MQYASRETREFLAAHGWQAGDPATAWVLTPDGVMVTNHHVFLDAEKEEVFGVMMSDGRFFPVTEILAADKLITYRIETGRKPPARPC